MALRTGAFTFGSGFLNESVTYAFHGVVGVQSASRVKRYPERAGLSGAAILRRWPMRQIEDGIQLLDEQHAALHEVAAAFYNAVSGLVSSCPIENPFTPVGRLEAEQRQLEALKRGIEIIQPIITSFEKLLTGAQRVRFKVMRLCCRFENRGRLGIWRRRS
jgi:hypothetical protein